METVSRPVPLFNRHTAFWAVVLAGTALAVWSFQDARGRDREHAQAEFMRRAAIRHALIREVLGRYEDALFGLSTLFRVDDDVTRLQFEQAARRLAERTPGVLALEWVPLVNAGQRAGFEAGLQRSQARPGLEITERAAGAQLVRAASRAAYLPICYIQPLAGSEAALGFDLMTGPTRTFLDDARANHRITLTGQIPLVQVPTDQPGLVMISPVWRARRTDEPPEAEEFLGYTQAVFLARDLLARTSTIQPDIILDMLFVDASEPDPAKQVLYYRPVNGGAAQPKPVPTVGEFHRDMVQELPLPIGGRDWRVLYRPRAGWIEEQFTPLPWVRTGGVLVITALLAGLVRTLGRRAELIKREVAERTRQLRASESRLQDIVDHSPAIIFLKDIHGRYLLCNQPFADFCGRPRADIIGRRDEDLFPAEDARLARENDRQVLAAGRPMEFEEHTTLTPHSRNTYLAIKFSLCDETGRAYALCGISTDISRRKQAEEELRENRRQLSNLIGQLPGAAFRCQFDENLTALFVSEGMLALTGYPAEDFTLGRRHIPDVTVPADRPVVRAAVAGAVQQRRPFEIEYRFTHRDGQGKWVLVRGRPIYAEDGTLRFIEGLAIDVTDLKQAEQQRMTIERRLFEGQKLESLGVMAGGIAHDFNNILTAVLVNASLARQRAAAGQAEGHLEQIENAAHRAADLCQQLLAYAGKGQLATDRVDLSELVRGTTSLLEVAVSKSIRLDLQLPAGLPPVLGDITQLRQIVMNLVINAADAIGDSPGRITVGTYACQAGADLLSRALGHPDLPTGPYVGLEVTDTGCGMPPEVQARIFEPFFSTKFSSRGLGLAAVRGIVQSHHGALFVESQPGAGSTFRLLLPATDGRAGPSTPPQPQPAAPTKLNGLVLVVDDEESVRGIVAAVLETYGATVLPAAGGEEALALLRAHGDRIALVLLDMTMPGISGEETLRRFRMINARPPVILMSGYSETETMKRTTDLGTAGFIQKPFEIEALLAKVRPFLT